MSRKHKHMRSELIGSFSNDENVKKTIGFSAKHQLCTCITLFCTFLCRLCTTNLRPENA